MPAQRPLRHLRLALSALAASLAAGCDIGRTFALYPEAESAAVAAAPWPTLLDAVQREQASGPALEPATGAALVDGLGAEAALSSERSARVSAPVLAIAPLRAEAAAARADRP